MSAAGVRLQDTAREDVFASSVFCFFSFLADILCQASMLSFAGLHFPLQAF